MPAHALSPSHYLLALLSTWFCFNLQTPLHFRAGHSAVGLAAAALGAAHVVVTDLACQMERMADNIVVNGMHSNMVAAPLVR